ncbi:MlaC/ttg2D family ABC transporter substrate-binding protein [Rhizobacter sp. LjRoot28]|uniref:MlaC/ttg2D family ABC transporter substrate-binding protein n=1 Tax=Rhizobacter sp. LjRoot28 TaxID=3342309 RepID=UPI003F50516E
MKHLMSWVAAVGFVAIAGAAQAQQTPDALVRQVSGEVLDAAKADKSIQSGDLARISALVESKVLPHVNFVRMTSKTIGPQWNKATPEQKKKVQEEFRTLLLRTYAGALSQVQDQTVEVRPVRDVSDESNVLVRSEIRGKGQPIQLDYRLEKAGDSWKIWDVNVSGLWLVTTYQGQFKPVVSQSGIDGVIKMLEDLNKSAANRS